MQISLVVWERDSDLVVLVSPPDHKVWERDNMQMYLKVGRLTQRVITLIVHLLAFPVGMLMSAIKINHVTMTI